MNGVVLIDPALAGARPLLRQLNPAAGDFDAGYRMLVELMPEAIWINRGGQVVYLNPAAQRLFGAADAGQLAGSDALARVPLESRHQMAQFTSGDAPCMPPPRCLLQLCRIDGTLVDVEYFGCAVRFNECESVLNLAHDVTERREHEQAIEHRATHDLLTGLPNRALFLDRLALAIRRAERHRGRLAVTRSCAKTSGAWPATPATTYCWPTVSRTPTNCWPRTRSAWSARGRMWRAIRRSISSGA